MSIQFLDPRQGSKFEGAKTAVRLDSLRGKRLGLLWNHRLGGEPLLREIGKVLAERHGLAEVYFTKKLFVGNPAPPEIIDDLVSRVDAVVVGIGD